MTTLKFKIDLKARRVRMAPAPAGLSAPPAPSAPVSTAARTLALAHFIEREVHAGRWKSYREAAVALAVSHTRVSHLTGLVLLPAGTQARVLLGTATPGERALRRTAAKADWRDDEPI